MEAEEAVLLLIAFHKNRPGPIPKKDTGAAVGIVCNFGQRICPKNQNLAVQS
ncbi:hypothetical protein D3C73_1591590 [compost metagenome]